MGRSIWSLIVKNFDNSSRFAQGSVILDKYVVKKILTRGQAFQLLAVEDCSDRCARIIRVLRRSLVPENRVSDDVRWLLDERNDDGRHAVFCGLISDYSHHYLIFERSGRSLQHVVRDSSLILTKRHIREIARQVLRAVRSLHADSILHTNISSANIDLVNPETVTELVYTADGTFRERKVLASSHVRLAFYGQAALLDSIPVGTDQYCAPEIVFGIGAMEESDVFSVGCVVADLIFRHSLFPAVADGPLYKHEKAILYDALLGPFPLTAKEDIRLRCPGVFDEREEDMNILDAGISADVRLFAESCCNLRDLATDSGDLAVLLSMLQLDYRRRPDLVFLEENFEFFSPTSF
ncbi:hypothetical protein CVT26_000821 [Gymnopilus dilepis]|uniref:Protein kinase domain-containing protein n=1 Tax=Gymnopilus dilepis TaxID=231916 RepID=A0A409WL47_9AGAR|nr:hypothetical protein CVT26_000821 [Gymnopilus dilepis]